MAAKLEVDVCQREKRKLLNDSLKPNDESEGSYHTPAVKYSEEVEKALKLVFLNLNLAIHNEDSIAQRFHHLEHAKSLAEKLVNR